jgi:hypothetical protein
MTNQPTTDRDRQNDDLSTSGIKVFISHVPSDRPFVDLIYHLLKYHGLQPWHEALDQDLLDIDTAEPETKIITSQGLENSDYLLVALSKRSLPILNSDHEINLFKTIHQSSQPIILLLLEQVENIADVFLLSEYGYIDFTRSMVEGFNDLLDQFGKQFLGLSDCDPTYLEPKIERRQRHDRRSGDRRQTDRRKSSISERLRYGFWKYYAQDTNATLDSCNAFDMELRYKAFGILLAEASRYHFFSLSDGKEIEPETALSNSFHLVWQHLSHLGSIHDCYFVEAVAAELCQSYLVKARDRRYPLDRRARQNRRVSEKI